MADAVNVMWGIGAETQKVSDDSGAATTIFMSQLLGTTETTLSWDKILPAIGREAAAEDRFRGQSWYPAVEFVT